MNRKHAVKRNFGYPRGNASNTDLLEQFTGQPDNKTCKFITTIISVAAFITSFAFTAGAQDITKTPKATLEIGNSYIVQLRNFYNRNDPKDFFYDYKFDLPRNGDLILSFEGQIENLYFALFAEDGVSLSPTSDRISSGRVSYARAGASGNPVDLFDLFGVNSNVIWFQWDNTIKENTGDFTSRNFTNRNVGEFIYTLDKGTYYLRLARTITVTGSRDMRVSLSLKNLDISIATPAAPAQTVEPRPEPETAARRLPYDAGKSDIYRVNRGYPIFDVFLGYSLMKVDKYDDKDGIIDYTKEYFDDACDIYENGRYCSFKNSGVLSKGFSASITYNFTSILGLNASFRYNAGDIFSFNGSGLEYGYNIEYEEKYKKDKAAFLVGPRFTYRNSTRITPFAYGLVGLSQDKLSHSLDYNFFGEHETDSGNLTHNSFGIALGGGLDISINDTFAIRAIQVDYFMANHPNDIKYIYDVENPDIKNKLFKDVNLSFGIVFRF